MTKLLDLVGIRIAFNTTKLKRAALIACIFYMGMFVQYLNDYYNMVCR